ncbi:hypothetical protein [Hyalangium versicolor]|uniref:hypothetical protein n=1 Tax=Hyalangium versicolor TaxID=2861190 RepID=UPI001CD013D6|nr:hypothetical protein [Hyalangium versicolor]
MGTLQIFLSDPIRTGQTKSAVVKVDGVSKGGEVEVTLCQTQGQQPLWGPETVKGVADTSGVAFVMFTVTLTGPSSMVCLKITARDSLGTFYEPNAHSFEVLP